MNVKNNIFCFVALLCFSVFTAWSAQLSPSAALARVVSKQPVVLKKAQQSNCKLVRTVSDTLGNKVLYVFRNNADGRLSFVSADDCAKPLLGYTDGFVESADSLPAPLENWLQTYVRQISYGISHPDKLRPLAVPQQSEDGLVLKTTDQDFPSIDVLLPYEWGTIPFNGLCPEVNGKNTKVGCVALAMFQIMNYWQYPEKGRDTVMYASKLDGKDTVFQHSLEGSVYDWDALGDLTTEKGKAAAAILGRDCAYAVHAKFGVDNTSAFSSRVPKALVRYFDYDSSMVCVGRSDPDMWFRIIYNELANARPVLYAGQGSYGHAFVCDGYNAVDTTFHFNFSWYGSCNGYFSLSAINPENGDQFNESNMAVIGIQPPGTFKKGEKHVFAYGDLTFSPTLYKRAGCHTLTQLGVSTTSSGFCSKGVYFAPPVYPSSQVALLIANDKTKDTLLLASAFGSLMNSADAVFEYGLYKAFDFVPLDNYLKNFSIGPTYTVSLLYRDSSGEDWRPVTFPDGARYSEKIRFNENGMIAVASDSTLPMLQTNWTMDHINFFCPPWMNGNRCSAGYDATAIGQMIFALQAPSKVFGEIAYDDVAIDTTFYFDYNLETQKNVLESIPFIGKAIRTKYGKTSEIHSVPGMVYGLHKNMGLSEVQYASRKFYTTANWIEMLDQNLQLGCPVYYAGYHILGSDSTRRAFVVDGYSADHFYHVNFGDGGRGDKYLNLDIVPYSGSTPGNSDWCFPYGQGMLTDFFTSCSVDTVNLPKHPFMLMQPLVVNSDSSLTELQLTSSDVFTLRFLLADCTKESVGYDADGSVTVGLGLFRQGKLNKVLASETFPVEKSFRSISTSLGTLSSGSYVLALVTKVGNGEWEMVYNNAPNKMTLTVKQGKITLSVPDNPSFGADLSLSAPMQVVKDKKKGLLARLPLSNYTSRNYEDVLRLVVNSGGKTFVSNAQVVAVYGHSNVTYEIMLDSILAETVEQGGTLLGYYYKDGSGWLPLQEETVVPLAQSCQTSATGVRVYSAGGVLLRSFAPSEVSSSYASFLSLLPVGVYVVEENGCSRKFVKYSK